MADESATAHLSPEEIADYFQGLLTEEREQAVEAHLGDCTGCVARAQQYHRFVALWEQWTPEAHGAAHLLARAQQALAEAQSARGEWGERLARWADRWRGRAEAVVRVVMEAPEQASRLVTEGLEPLLREGATRRFALLPEPIRVRGAEGVEVFATIAIAPGSPEVRVTVDGEQREVVALVTPSAAGRAAPLVMLIPDDPAAEVRIGEPRPEVGSPELVARFEHLPKGGYVVALEPEE